MQIRLTSIRACSPLPPALALVAALLLAAPAARAQGAEERYHAADRKLNILWKSLPKTSRARLKAGQRAWVASQATCDAHSGDRRFQCLHDLTRARLSVLGNEGPAEADTAVEAGKPGFTSPASKRWRKRHCYDYDPASGWLKVRIYKNMTLSDLAMHFNFTDFGRIKGANPSIKRNQLQNRAWYWIPTQHLTVFKYVIKPGDTNKKLKEHFKLPTVYSIRAWNCLPSHKIKAGDSVMIYQRKNL